MTISLNFQESQPVFVRSFNDPIIWRGKTYKHNARLPWLEVGMTDDYVRQLFALSKLYHNSDLAKDLRVGDQLDRFSGPKLATLVNLVNSYVEKNTNSKQELRSKNIKKSRLEDKQKALIRQWLGRSSPEMREEFETIRDSLLEDY